MATAFKIDQNVPMPTGRALYPLGQLNIGDSFCFPLTKRASVSSLAATYAPKKFTVRKISDTECRVWRIA